MDSLVHARELIAAARAATGRRLLLARTMVATAVAQALVAVAAVIAGSTEGVVLTAFFAALWLASAALFRKAARGQTSTGAAL